MRKLIQLWIIIAVAFVPATLKAETVNVEIDGIKYNLYDDGTAAVTYLDGDGFTTNVSKQYVGEITIPSSTTYEGKEYPVTSIGFRAFYNCSGLTSVTIGNSVTYIGMSAFYCCNNLTAITIPNSVTSIGKNAFSGCTGLTSVIISDLAAWCGINFGYDDSNPLSYAHNLYLNDEKITKLVIPSSVTSIGSCTFYGCTGLTSVTIPESVTSIGGGAFYGCSGLTSVTIPESVTSIGGNAFYRCSGLTSVTIPNSVTSIGKEAFYGTGLTSVIISDLASWCSINFGDGSSNPLSYAHHLYLNDDEITELVIPSSVTSIGGYAFYGCSGLTSVTIPESVTNIGEDAFYGCTGLTSVTIPESVTSIGTSAFYGCSGLTSVTIPESVTSIGKEAFYGTGLTSVIISDLASWCGINFDGYSSNPLYYAQHLYLNDDEITELVIPSSVTSIGSYAFYGYTGLTSVTIGNSVTSIGEYAFSDCSGLTSVTIGNSVTSIGKSAFSGCSGLTSVIISDLASWCGINFDGYFSNPLYYAHHLYLNDDEITELVIPSSVTSIGDYVFSGCSGLTSATIGNSVTSIGLATFARCSGLTSVTIGNSVTTIGNSAFLSCSGLTSVTIGNSVTSIENNAFLSCSGLTELYVMATTPPVASSSVFIGLTKANVTLHVPAGCIPAYQAANVWKDFTNIEEWTPAGISSTEAEAPTVAGYNDLNGRCLDTPAKGLNIVRYSDGTTRKVIVK